MKFLCFSFYGARTHTHTHTHTHAHTHTHTPHTHTSHTHTHHTHTCIVIGICTLHHNNLNTFMRVIVLPTIHGKHTFYTTDTENESAMKIASAGTPPTSNKASRRVCIKKKTGIRRKPTDSTMWLITTDGR